MWYQIAFRNLSDSILKPSGPDFGPIFLSKWPAFSKENLGLQALPSSKHRYLHPDPASKPLGTNLEAIWKHFGINFRIIFGDHMDDRSIIHTIEVVYTRSSIFRTEENIPLKHLRGTFPFRRHRFLAGEKFSPHNLFQKVSYIPWC